jgi:hypothetical protein
MTGRGNAQLGCHFLVALAHALVTLGEPGFLKSSEMALKSCLWGQMDPGEWSQS